MSETATEALLAKVPREESLAAARAARMEKYFGGGKTYRVDRAVDLPEGQVFQTPFGNKGRHGFILVRTENGQDVLREDGKPDACVFGITVIRNAAETYPGSVEVPSVSKKKSQTVHVTDGDTGSGGDDAAPAAEAPESNGGTPEALENPSVG